MIFNIFASQKLLWLLLIVPCYIYFEVFKKPKRSLYFSQVSMIKKAAVKNYNWLEYLLLTVRVLALILLIIALARPQYQTEQKEIFRKGVDIVLAFDASGSMAAEDLDGNRLSSAKKIMQKFISKRNNDRIGLVVFGTQAVTKVPLTFDGGMLINVLEKVKLGEAGEGTAIGQALVNSLNRLRESEAKSKIIVLVTDGENNAGAIGPQEAAGLAKDIGIKIYTVGIGSAEGAPIPMTHPRYGKQYARNPDGTIYMTKLNTEELVKIADKTNGRFFQARSTKELGNIFNEIDKLEKIELKTDVHYKVQERFELFLLFGLLLLLAAVLFEKTLLRIT